MAGELQLLQEALRGPYGAWIDEKGTVHDVQHAHEQTLKDLMGRHATYDNAFSRGWIRVTYDFTRGGTIHAHWGDPEASPNAKRALKGEMKGFGNYIFEAETISGDMPFIDTFEERKALQFINTH